jgi:hypothetical protein
MDPQTLMQLMTLLGQNQSNNIEQVLKPRGRIALSERAGKGLQGWYDLNPQARPGESYDQEQMRVQTERGMAQKELMTNAQGKPEKSMAKGAQSQGGFFGMIGELLRGMQGGENGKPGSRKSPKSARNPQAPAQASAPSAPAMNPRDAGLSALLAIPARTTIPTYAQTSPDGLPPVEFDGRFPVYQPQQLPQVSMNPVANRIQQNKQSWIDAYSGLNNFIGKTNQWSTDFSNKANKFRNSGQ